MSGLFLSWEIALESNIVRMVPQDIEAEENVLGSILILPEAIDKILPICTQEDFYREKNRHFFKACLALKEAKEPIDAYALKAKLEKDGFENLGSFISILTERVPTAANVEYYAKKVKEKSDARKLLIATNEIQADIYAEELDTKQLFDSAEHKIFQATNNRKVQDFIEVKEIASKSYEYIHWLADRENGLTGLSSGLKMLDEYTGGFQNSELIIIGARPGIGKTSLALNIAEHFSVELNHPVGFFSLEMTKDQLLLRLFCSMARVQLSKKGKTFFDQAITNRLVGVANRLHATRFFINDSAFLSILEVKALARRLKEQYGIKALLVDYLQLIHAGIKTQNREQEVSYISRHLKALAKDLEIPVIVLAQLSRPPKGNEDKRPYLSDLRESGAIEQDADVVIFIHKPTEDLHELIIAKQRNGPTGIVPVKFLEQYTRFELLANQGAES